MKILVLNGVNLGRLGKRQPEIYGFDTLRALNKRLKRYASAKNITLKFFQTDSEPALLKKINRVSLDAIILNAGAWSHYSYAVRDAVAACCVPVVEVHLSDITARESFRKIRVLEGVVAAAFWGEGLGSYEKPLIFLRRRQYDEKKSGAYRNVGHAQIHSRAQAGEKIAVVVYRH